MGLLRVPITAEKCDYPARHSPIANDASGLVTVAKCINSRADCYDDKK
jgi:hypothetical protein